MKRIMALALGLIILNGCSGFQLSSNKKEVVVDSISPSTITVTFCGNAYMSQKEVEKYALQRASSEALSKGYSYFIVVNKEDKSKFCALSFGKNQNNAYTAGSLRDSGSLSSSDFVEPNVMLTIRCVPKGEKIPENAINAQEFLNENFPGLSK